MYLFAIATLGSSAWAYSKYEADKQKSILGSAAFVPYTLKAAVPVSSTSSIFTFVPKATDGDFLEVHHLHGQGIWSAEVKQPQLQIAREYTPLPLSDGAKERFGPNALQFLIRKEIRGEVSGWIHKLPIGADISIRGPRSQYALPDGVDEVLFLAGGTGIAPALQLAHSLLDFKKSKENIKMHIMWANRRREDCVGGISDTQKTKGWFRWWPQSQPVDPALEQPVHKSHLVVELESLKLRLGGRLNVGYFVDDEGSFINMKALKPVLAASNPTGESGVALPRKNRLILISGPDGFVAYLAGPKLWQGRQEGQGDLAGLLKEAEKLGWKVWKL